MVMLIAGVFCEENYDACELQPCGVDGTCLSDLPANQFNNRGYMCASCDQGYRLTYDSKCEGLSNSLSSSK